MDQKDGADLTALLSRWSGGDKGALESLVSIIYEDLHRIAAQHLRKERAEHTLQPTALVNEAYVRLAGQNVSWKNRAHFFAVSAEIMRRILVDHARRKLAEKRGGGAETISIDAGGDWGGEPAVDVISIDDALNALAAVDPAQSRIVELRFFGGLTIEETAETIGSSPSTVKREWRMARAWLRRHLSVP
jgi:RNA polymerase sigma factor, sigma-70 family/RNA polymerase sigma factor, TIGR02999 family